MLLDKIKSSADLHRLPDRLLPRLAEELRYKILQTTASNGGHLASSMGVVELTIALHRELSLPQDHIVWDVGHQAYAHKILTGRADAFAGLRLEGGLSGFPKAAESDCDAFVAGHSSTSISAALGIASAKKMRGDRSKTVAVIGDGALTGGMAFEGLNNAGHFGGNFVVILNDNEQSISKSTGSMAGYLASVRNKPEYFRFKDFIERKVRQTPLVGEQMRDFLSQTKTLLKETLYPSTFFEDLGFFYLGPVDGHNMEELQSVLRRAFSINSPVFVHIHTKKGKGYLPAERNPAAFHGVSPFDLKKGVLPQAKENFSSVFGEHLKNLAKNDSSIAAITAAMPDGTGLADFAKAYPDRFFDVGIAEEHAVTFAGGLAAGGMKPVFAVYSTFLQRGFDQVLHDLAIEKRHVVLAVDRAGLVGEDGETHQGVFDVSFLRSVPGVKVFSPSSFAETRYFMEEALYRTEGVVVLRYPRGGERPTHKEENTCFALFAHRCNSDQKKVLLVSYGRITDDLFAAAEELTASDIPADVLKLVQIEPLPENAVAIAAEYEQIFFFEEGVVAGGVAEGMLRKLHQSGWNGKMTLCGVEGFAKQSSVEKALAIRNLEKGGMVQKVREVLA